MSSTACTPPAPKALDPVEEVTANSVSLSKGKDTEYTAICNSLYGFAPVGVILEIQIILRMLKIAPTDSAIKIESFIIPLVIIALITFTLGMIWKLSKKHWKIVIPVILILILVYYFVVIKKNESFVNNSVAAVAQPIENFQIVGPPTVGDEYFLLNIQPAAIKQIGYVGPSEVNGAFDPPTNIINTMTGGVNFFILQIDYLDNKKDPAKFDKVGVPTLLYRNNSGVIVSSNGASIADIAKNLATYAFNNQFPNSLQPIILYLHFVRTPNYLMEPDKYIKFLSATAAALAPIQSLILQKEEDTIFSRQQNEKILLHTPLHKFEKQIILLTNVDTSLYRNLVALRLPTVPLASDLDYLVSLRVYLENENVPVDATMALTSNLIPYAVILPYSSLKKMNTSQRNIFAEKGKHRFTIAMPNPMDKPSASDLTDLMTTTGVNVIPINMFGQTFQDMKGSLTAWGTTPFFKIKPLLLQSTVVAATPYSGQMSSPA